MLRVLKVSYSDKGEGGVAVNCEKTQFFLDTLYVLYEYRHNCTNGVPGHEVEVLGRVVQHEGVHPVHIHLFKICVNTRPKW